MRTTRLVGLLLVAAGAVGCADSGSSPSQPSPGDGVTPSVAGGPAAFQARPVLAVQGRDLDGSGLEPGLVRRLEALDCLRKPPTTNAPTAEAMLACDARGAGFLLGPAGVDGGVQQAEVVGVRGGGFAVQVGLDQASADALGDLVGGLVGSEGRFAVVVEGTVIDLPSAADGVGANLQIGGDWTRAEADDVAARLT